MNAAALLTVAIVVIAIASRPVEVRLWRRGVISYRTLTALLLARLPVLIVLVGLIWWGFDPLTTVVVPVLIAVGEVMAYPLLRTVLDDARREREKARQAT